MCNGNQMFTTKDVFGVCKTTTGRLQMADADNG